MTVLEPIFDPTFIDQSFPCRKDKGVHKWVSCLRSMLQKESKSNKVTCYVLKCDVAKFFDSIDHKILISLLWKKITDDGAMELLRDIIWSFKSERSDEFISRGVPIWNLTSQLFANVYMNEFDQFMKCDLKVRYYARYTDDFVIVSKDKEYLERLLVKIQTFLENNLHINLHPEKVSINKYSQGVDFLWYVTFPKFTLVRGRTKKRILRKWKQALNDYEDNLIDDKRLGSSLNSYLGVLSHANAHNFSQDLRNQFCLYDNKS